MQTAIEVLRQAAESCEANIPIYEAEGKHEQAEQARQNAKEYREAIAHLRAVAG